MISRGQISKCFWISRLRQPIDLFEINSEHRIAWAFRIRFNTNVSSQLVCPPSVHPWCPDELEEEEEDNFSELRDEAAVVGRRGVKRGDGGNEGAGGAMDRGAVL